MAQKIYEYDFALPCSGRDGLAIEIIHQKRRHRLRMGSQIVLSALGNEKVPRRFLALFAGRLCSGGGLRACIAPLIFIARGWPLSDPRQVQWPSLRIRPSVANTRDERSFHTPPCTSFSIMGQRNTAGKRGKVGRYCTKTGGGRQKGGRIQTGRKFPNRCGFLQY